MIILIVEQQEPMSGILKQRHLVQSYEEAIKNAAYISDPIGRARGRVSRVNSLSAPITFALVFSGLLLTITLVLRAFLYSKHPLATNHVSLRTQLSFLLVFYALYFAASVIALVIKNLVLKRLPVVVDFLLLAVVVSAITPISLWFLYQPSLMFINLGCSLALVIFGKITFWRYSIPGVNFYLALCAAALSGLAWTGIFLYTLPVSVVTKALIWSTVPFLLIALPSRFLHMFELYDVVCKEHWRRLRHPFPKGWINFEPFVSIQVPTYSEPPEVVIQTLNSLAQLEYKNYEVIVIDNNTQDPSLWKPVQDHCLKLGKRFKFLHIDNLEGAKAGALNYITKYADPRTTVIGVVDADYQADKTFLESLVSFFRDPNIGFVQTPHDYRAWRNNLFLTMCYWEYRLFFHTAMISLNEREAGITVGTMCLIRKDALEQAGGWSEWCVTEDSELAIRIHDLGYSSVYVDKSYGQGLIPDTFEGYKKQRYRWTAGPIQEFRHYYPHFIGLANKQSKFKLKQRIFHLNHGLGNFLLAFNIPILILSVAITVSLVMHHEIIKVPIELWIAATITFLASPLLNFMLYRVTVNATSLEILGQAIATKALSHVVSYAAIRTAVTGSAEWSRTSKFKSSESYWAALYSTKEETLIGLTLLVFSISAYVAFPYTGLSMMLLIGIIYITIGYFAAPFMAVIGVWSLRHDHIDVRGIAPAV